MTHPRLDACVIDTRRSLYARLAAVPLAHVELHDAFWRPRSEANGRLTLRTQRRSGDGRRRRSEWLGVACCPPSLARTVAALPGYGYGVARDGLWVHLYAASTPRTTLLDGTPVALRQDTRYPWDGDVRVTVETADHPDDPRDLILPRTPDAMELVDHDLQGAVPALRARSGRVARHRPAVPRGVARRRVDRIADRPDRHPLLRVGEPCARSDAGMDPARP